MDCFLSGVSRPGSTEARVLCKAPGRLWLEGGRDKQKLDALVVAEVLAVGKGARKKSSL